MKMDLGIGNSISLILIPRYFSGVSEENSFFERIEDSLRHDWDLNARNSYHYFHSLAL
jgi:hypothetical protein